jgi:AGZA family xanthine/uracil permease-like MFS transporter
MRAFARGDIDGFFGLALDNLVQLLVLATLCQTVLGFPEELIAGRVLPGAAVSLLIGNLFYAWQARRKMIETGRDDWCALPYGINTVSLFAFVFLVMLPVKLSADAAGLSDGAQRAWRAGLVACFGCGLIEFLGAFVAPWIRRVTPRAALLSTLAGIALTFISAGFLFRTFAHPLIGLATLAIVMLTYFGRVRFRGGLPGGLVAVLLGLALSWTTGLAPLGAPPPSGVVWQPPVPVLGELWAAFHEGYATAFFSVILPMGLFTLVGSMQNLESAEAAGDRYSTRSSLVANGIGSMVAAGFGSCFPTTLYIGHPGWKAMGARAGYSVANAAFASLICFTGWLSWIAWAVPIDAGMAIVLWIGVMITAQAFQTVPRAHAPAVVMGLLPGLAGFAAYMGKAGLRVAGAGTPDGTAFSPSMLTGFQGADIYFDGALRLEQGFILSAMILSAATVCVIERQFVRAGLWCAAAAALSALGLLHAYRWTPVDTVIDLAPAWPWVEAYVVMAALFFIARWVTVPNEAKP